MISYEYCFTNQPSKECPIDACWIIERNTGICLFESDRKNVKSEEISVDLLCGFIFAISKFTSEVFLDTIRHLEMGKRNLIFEFSESLIFILAVKKKQISKEKLEAMVKKLSKTFVAKYKDRLKHWNGEVKQFEDFSKNLNDVW